MPSEPLFTNFFGAGATQTAAEIIILKNDLVAPVGLVPSYIFAPAAVNNPESTALAMFLRWQRNQDPSTDSQFRITPFEQSLEFQVNKWLRRYSCQVEIWQEDATPAIPNPNSI
jgi:hypothetical protein